MSKWDDKEKGGGKKDLWRRRPVRQTLRETRTRNKAYQSPLTDGLSRNCKDHFKEGERGHYNW